MSDKRQNMQARKELLIARASIERLEFAAHIGRAKAAVSPSQMLKSVLPRLTSGGGMTTAFQVWRTLRRYPMVSSVASMLLARVRFRGVFRLLKFGGGAFVAYEAFKIWRGFKAEQPMREARRRSRQASGQDEG